MISAYNSDIPVIYDIYMLTYVYVTVYMHVKTDNAYIGGLYMACKIVCFGNTKGGVGKSSLSVFTAAEAARNGKRVMLVDADPQKSSALWRASRQADDIVCMSITEATLHKDVPKLAEGFDLVVIDAGGRDSATFRSAVLAADILIIPVLPSQFDIYATEDTLQIYKDAQVYRDDTQAYFVLNQLLVNTKISRDAESAVEDMTKKWGILPLNSQLHARVAFKECLEFGQGVTEYEPEGKAADEMRMLYREIMKLAGEGK